MNPQEIFQSFFSGPQMQEPLQQIPEYIYHNEAVLEIINNWNYVRDLMLRKAQGKLQQVDQWEQLWYNFLVPKNINIFEYSNEQEFLKSFWRMPETDI